MKFNAKLRTLIGNKDQAEVAALAGITPQALSNYLNERSRPNALLSVKLEASPRSEFALAFGR